jgi:hypothetical protein
MAGVSKDGRKKNGYPYRQLPGAGPEPGLTYKLRIFG